MKYLRFRAWDGVNMYLSPSEPYHLGSWFDAHMPGALYRGNIIITQFTGFYDYGGNGKRGEEIYAGDILFCEGGKGWMSGDGHLPKKYPRNLDGYVVVKAVPGGFDFDWYTAIPEHREADNVKFYREFRFSPDNPPKQCKYFGGNNKWYSGDGVTCINYKKVGNIYQNMALLKGG